MMKFVRVAALIHILLATFVSAFTVSNNKQNQNYQLFSTSGSNVEEKSRRQAEAEEAKNPRLMGLALLLDDGTRKSHSVAQNSAFVTGFFKGLSTRDSYRALITSLYFVYSAMEDAFDTTTEDRVVALDDPQLRRVHQLEQDMDFFYGAQWRDVIQPSAATRTYVARVKEVAEKQPYLLVAHQYTRYLGDLFGTYCILHRGRIVAGLTKSALNSFFPLF